MSMYLYRFLWVLSASIIAGEELVQTQTSEAFCYVEHFPYSSCPYDGLETCIKNLQPDSHTKSKAIATHLMLITLEKTFCLLNMQHDPCVQKEIDLCTRLFNILDAYEDSIICNQIRPTRRCLARINETCGDPMYRTMGMIELFSDRVDIAEKECTIGFYNELLCGNAAIMGCVDRLIKTGLNCTSSFRDDAENCLLEVERKCQTVAQQRMVRREKKTLWLYCPK